MPAREDRVSAALARRCAGLPWEAMAASLDARGYATTGPFLDAAECVALVELYGDEPRFRSRVDMARFRFGEGEYKYFAAPLPEPVATMRQALYPPLAPVANRWAERLGVRERFPADLDGLARLCARHGQTRPTPLLLRYGKGGYNCLHQDLYGKVAFPLQPTGSRASPSGISPAASSSWWNSGRAPSRPRTWSRSRAARRCSSPRVTGPPVARAAGIA